MKVLLAFVFLCITIGLIAPRIGRRESVMIVVSAIVMAFLYYRFGERFM
jgi:hypothetical protein